MNTSHTMVSSNSGTISGSPSHHEDTTCAQASVSSHKAVSADAKLADADSQPSNDSNTDKTADERDDAHNVSRCLKLCKYKLRRLHRLVQSWTNAAYYIRPDGISIPRLAQVRRVRVEINKLNRAVERLSGLIADKAQATKADA
ncbi:hypothetical protein FLONG3_1840 [Fusarium longipes]|uniref:Uncharacterized protein n=1 Tax=Fusarium longipes TaxID=694270 RepID=A0A395T6M9_9HYPO|nr:hypothetical protein FLONG3_1840 [Fusarium longipes]